MRRVQSTRAVCGLLALVLGAAGGPAVGPEFQVNTYTPSHQDRPRLTADGAGNFVVVWRSRYQDGDEEGIFGQRLTGDGRPVGREFQVNTTTAGSQWSGAVAASRAGEFVVVWGSYDPVAEEWDVFGQRFAADAARAGEEFRINAATSYSQWLPAVASDAAGNFTVVWEGYGDPDDWGVFGRRYAADGRPLGPEFLVNGETTDLQGSPAIGADAAGDFVVAWSSRGQDGDGYGVFARRFAADGSALGDEFQVNTFTADHQAAPAVALEAGGTFVIVWQSRGQDGSYDGIFGQRYAADGGALGDEFQINASSVGVQAAPAVATDPQGGFVVAWQDGQRDGDLRGVFARRFAADGLPLGDEFQVNTETANDQLGPSIAANGPGRFVVAWSSTHQDGSGDGVFGQRFVVGVFADGFESGDTSAWSGSVP